MQPLQRTILIIDSSSIDRAAYRQYLLADPQWHYTILEAPSTQTGLDLYQQAIGQQANFDGVLLAFPDSDREAIAFITDLKTRTYVSPPVVVIDGSDATLAVRAFKAGAEDYLIRSQITPDALRFAMKSAIENAELRRRLRLSTERFRTSVENLIDCFGIFSALRDASGAIVDFRIDYLNAAALDSNSMTADVIGQPLCQVLPSHRETCLFEEYCQVVETGQSLTKTNFVYADQYGETYLTRIFDIRASKLGDGFVSAWQDVTDRRQQEVEKGLLRVDMQQTQAAAAHYQQHYALTAEQLKQAQKSSQQQLQEIEAIYAYAPIGLCFVDTDLRFVRINERLAAINGVSVADHLGRTIQEVIPDLYDLLEPLYRQVLETGQPIINHELYAAAPRQSGVLHHWLVNYYPLHGAEGETIGINVMVQDITDRKQSELALRQNQEQLQQLVDNAPVGIGIGTAMGDVSFINDELLRIHGYTRAEFERDGFNWRDFSPPEYAELNQQAMRQLQQDGFIAPAEKEIARRDGTRVPVLISAIRWGNNEDEHVAFVVDLTDRKQSEAALRNSLMVLQQAREAAELANHTKDEFLAIVAHDLRSPLNTILGWTQLLQTKQRDPDTVQRALETIERSAKAQNELIEDLLDMSRLIRGDLRLDRVPLNLVEIVEHMVTGILPTAQAKQLQIDWFLPPEPYSVSGDLHRLQQIMANLLSNAIKFTPPNGKITVQLAQTNCSGSPLADQPSTATAQAAQNPAAQNPAAQNPYAQIIVSDTGKGIAPEFLPYVFDRFRRADNATSRSKDGLGLGLAIVRHLVELMDGQVTVTSPGEGKGATFTVWLPLLLV